MALRFVMLLAFVLAGFAGYSQETTTKKSFRPDIPGSVLVELGVNVVSGNAPSHFQKGFWGSRTINFYYQYPIRLFKSNFSLNPGIGLSLERWKLTNDYTIASRPGKDGTYRLLPADSIFTGSTIHRSQLVNNYIEMPLELRYDTNPEDIARSFNISFGGRVGYLYDSFAKVDYRENSENKSNKDKQMHGMNPIRYGLYTRFGLGGFSLFGYFNMSPMYEKDKGPEKTTMTSMTFGISINGF